MPNAEDATTTLQHAQRLEESFEALEKELGTVKGHDMGDDAL